MPSNRSISRREVFVPTPFTIWEDEPRSPQPLQPQPHNRHILSPRFIPPLIRPSTPVSGRSSPATPTGAAGGPDPIRRDPSTPPAGGSKRGVETVTPKKERRKRGIAGMVGRVKGALHRFLKGTKHE